MLYLFQNYQNEFSAERETVIVGVNDDIPAFISGIETRRVAITGMSPDAEEYGWKEVGWFSGWDIPKEYIPAKKLTIHFGGTSSITWQLYRKITQPGVS